MRWAGAWPEDPNWLESEKVCLIAASRAVICQATVLVRLPMSHSLKDRRQVTRSLVRRLRNRYNVSAVDASDDSWQMASIVVASAGPTRAHAQRTAQAAAAFIEAQLDEGEIVVSRIEVIYP